MALEQSLWVQAESIVGAVSDKFIQVWPTFRQMAPNLLEDIGLFAPVDRVDLVANAWTQLAGKTKDLQH
jgi:hypothetical protein